MREGARRSVGVGSGCPEVLKGVNTHTPVDALGVWDTPSPFCPSSPTYVRPVLMEVGRRFLETREPTRAIDNSNFSDRSDSYLPCPQSCGYQQPLYRCRTEVPLNTATLQFVTDTAASSSRFREYCLERRIRVSGITKEVILCEYSRRQFTCATAKGMLRGSVERMGAHFTRGPSRDTTVATSTDFATVSPQLSTSYQLPRHGSRK